jgi:CHAT domain-containing protein/tetratricopeptide (TPR) repeat protein
LRKRFIQQVYGKKRPFESRITGFDYSPLNQTRGGDENQIDILTRDRAERNLLEAAATNKTSSSLYWLGKFYLAEKNFDKAINYFEQASRLNPADAKLQADLGAALLEAGKKAKEEKDGAKSYELLNSSLKYLERAIELDPKLLEPRFNRALSQEAIPMPEQAEQAWREYLELDSSSNWADEARQRLKKLESQKPHNLSAAEIEKAFLTAFRQKNDTEAGTLISQSREIITQKYLPQRLAISFIEAPYPEKKEYLDALIYAGELEEKNINDSFAKDLAAYYTKVSDADLELLKQAHVLIRHSFTLCLDSKYKAALEEARRAWNIFLQAGNVYEAKLSEFLVVYCLISSEQIRQSILPAEELANTCRKSNYKWLLSNTLYWLAAAQRTTGDRTKAKATYKKCLVLAEEIRDPQVLQKILVSFARQNNFVGQKKAAMDYLHRAFDEAGNTPELSLRERWRTYSDGIEILVSSKLINLAKAVSLESIQFARDLEGTFFIYSRLDAGIVHMQAGDYDESRILLNEVQQNAETMAKGTEQKELLAKSLLTLAFLERKLKNYSEAKKLYDEALSIVEKSEYPFFLYEIQKGRLLADTALNNETNIEDQITETINLAETYRKEIAEEQERNSFFNNEQDIYDIAIANEFKQGNYSQAYNYLEISNARSLLDWIRKGANVKEEKKKIEITFNENDQPLQFEEIQRQMPEHVQILQYAILENKVLIWLITKDNFTVISTDIGVEKLNEKITTYTELVSAHNYLKQDEATELSRELYDLLISPVINKLDSKREICLIPHKVLFHLPFAALTASNGEPFLAQFNFFYAPSANVFLLSTEKASQKTTITTESLLSIGNPSFDRKAFKEFQNLPDAEEEAVKIKEYYSKESEVLIGPKATKKAVHNSLKNAEVVHFAGHYIVKHGEPLFSGLLLTQTENVNDPEDNILTNAELTRQQLPQVKLVVLSACQTGIEQYYDGEGLVGLSRTFLAAGAPLVVASQWQVDSKASAELMKKFHLFRKQEKLSTTAALRRAQLEMFKAPDGHFRHPYFWAAFAAYGGYAEF